MKKALKIILVVFIAVVLLLGAGLAYVVLNARGIILPRLEKSLGVSVSASAIRLSWPLAAQMDDLVVGQTIKVKRVEVVPGFTGLFTVGMVFDRITLQGPYVRVTRTGKDTFDFGLPAAGDRKKPQTSFVARRIILKGGRVEFVDQSLDGGPFTLYVDDLNAEARQASLMQPTRIRFRASAVVKTTKEEEVATLQGNGWIDWIPKDADAVVALKDADLTYLEPYYRQYLQKDLQSGHLQAQANMKAVHNELKVDTHVELMDIAFKKEAPAAEGAQEQPEDIKDLTYLAFDSILSSEGKAVFDFSITTKLDHPKLENLKIKGSFLKSRIQAAVTNPQETIEEYKKVGEQFEAIGKEFKKMFKGD